MFGQLVKYKKVILVLLCALFVLGFLTYSIVSPRGFLSGLSDDLAAINPSPESAYIDLEGNKIDLTTYKGKVLIINSWASWSPFSEAELKGLSELQKKYSTDDVVILAINRMESTPTIHAYLGFIGRPENLVYVVDTTDNFYKAVGGFAMPETIVYTKDGAIAHHARGVLNSTELEALVASLHQEQ